MNLQEWSLLACDHLMWLTDRQQATISYTSNCHSHAGTIALCRTHDFWNLSYLSAQLGGFRTLGSSVSHSVQQCKSVQLDTPNPTRTPQMASEPLVEAHPDLPALWLHDLTGTDQVKRLLNIATMRWLKAGKEHSSDWKWLLQTLRSTLSLNQRPVTPSRSSWFPTSNQYRTGSSDLIHSLLSATAGIATSGVSQRAVSSLNLPSKEGRRYQIECSAPSSHCADRRTKGSG